MDPVMISIIILLAVSALDLIGWYAVKTYRQQHAQLAVTKSG